MDSETRRRLVDAIEQARARAAEALAEIEQEPDASRRVESAVRDAEAALSRLLQRIDADG